MECLHYEDALEVTDVEDLLDYIESARDIADFSDIGRDALRQLLTAQMKNGVLHIPKDYGMFVCRI